MKQRNATVGTGTPFTTGACCCCSCATESRTRGSLLGASSMSLVVDVPVDRIVDVAADSDSSGSLRLSPSSLIL